MLLRPTETRFISFLPRNEELRKKRVEIKVEEFPSRIGKKKPEKQMHDARLMSPLS